MLGLLPARRRHVMRTNVLRLPPWNTLLACAGGVLLRPRRGLRLLGHWLRRLA